MNQRHMTLWSSQKLSSLCVPFSMSFLYLLIFDCFVFLSYLTANDDFLSNVYLLFTIIANRSYNFSVKYYFIGFSWPLRMEFFFINPKWSQSVFEGGFEWMKIFLSNILNSFHFGTCFGEEHLFIGFEYICVFLTAFYRKSDLQLIHDANWNWIFNKFALCRLVLQIKSVYPKSTHFYRRKRL